MDFILIENTKTVKRFVIFFVLFSKSYHKDSAASLSCIYIVMKSWHGWVTHEPNMHTNMWEL